MATALMVIGMIGLLAAILIPVAAAIFTGNSGGDGLLASLYFAKYPFIFFLVGGGASQGSPLAEPSAKRRRRSFLGGRRRGRRNIIQGEAHHSKPGEDVVDLRRAACEEAPMYAEEFSR